MAELKTQENDGDVEAFVAAIENDGQRADVEKLLRLMKRVTRKPPKMWGPGIIGFGQYHYRYASGREGDWFVVGVSPRKGKTTVYVTSGFEIHEDALARLGKHKTGVGCLYIKRLEDIDLKVLEGILRDGWKHVKTNMDKPTK